MVAWKPGDTLLVADEADTIRFLYGTTVGVSGRRVGGRTAETVKATACFGLDGRRLKGDRPGYEGVVYSRYGTAVALVRGCRPGIAPGRR